MLRKLVNIMEPPLPRCTTTCGHGGKKTRSRKIASAKGGHANGRCGFSLRQEQACALAECFRQCQVPRRGGLCRVRGAYT